MTRDLGDARLLENLLSGKINNYVLTGWRSGAVGGGVMMAWPNSHGGLEIRTSATANSTIAATNAGLIAGSIHVAGFGGDTRYIDWSTRFRLFIKFGEYTGMTANCGYRGFIGSNMAAQTPSFANPTAKGVGFIVRHLSGSNGQIYSVLHDGTTYSESVSSFATVNNRMSNGLLIDSNGAGTVSYYLNGVLIGSSTGGPTGLSASGGTSIVFAASNGADATDTRLGIADLKVIIGVL
jgi:hypothetical protein